MFPQRKNGLSKQHWAPRKVWNAWLLMFIFLEQTISANNKRKNILKLNFFRFVVRQKETNKDVLKKYFRFSSYTLFWIVALPPPFAGRGGDISLNNKKKMKFHHSYSKLPPPTLRFIKRANSPETFFLPGGILLFHFNRSNV